jgi:hypothetical protein
MTDELKVLIDKAKAVEMTPAQKEEQRQSFAYGNTKIENPLITREMVQKASDSLKSNK